MRWDRIIARILLIFSVANVALAAPAVVRQRHLDVAEASRKRGNEAGTVSEQVPESSGSADPESDPYFSASEESVSDLSDHSDVESLSGWLHGSQAGSEHADSDTESLSAWLAQDPAPSNSIFTDDLKRKLKKISIWGAAAVISAVTYGFLRKSTGGASSEL
jgi:hypothetical protein